MTCVGMWTFSMNAMHVFFNQNSVNPNLLKKEALVKEKACPILSQVTTCKLHRKLYLAVNYQFPHAIWNLGKITHKFKNQCERNQNIPESR